MPHAQGPGTHEETNVVVLHEAEPITVREVLEFQGATLTELEYRGSPVVLATELSLALGYASRNALTKRVRGTWSGEFKEGTHYHFLKGQECRAIFELVPTVGTSRVSSAVVLTAAGQDLVCVKTSKVLGVELRKFLVESGIVRAILTSKEVKVEGKVVTPQPATTPANNREDRLWKREERLARQEERRCAELALRILGEVGGACDPDGLAALKLGLVEQVTGQSVTRALPVEEVRWYSATEAARILGTNTNVFGKARKRLGLDGALEGFTRMVSGARKNSTGVVPLVQYTKAAIERVAADLAFVPDWSRA